MQHSVVAERSEASSPGRTTEMGVVLYGSPSSFWCVCVCVRVRVRVCVRACVRVCVYTNLKFLLPTTTFHARPYLKNRFRVRLQMSLRTIRLGDRTAEKMLPELSSPHPFVL